jgi:DNA invertase Pin-like site-specific DNA recombinase
VVYKVDRLSRALLDFTRMLSVFEKHNVSFVAVTRQFNTSTSLVRLTLNILFSFAQFERQLIGERTRDKMSAARRKGKWVGGCPVLAAGDLTFLFDRANPAFRQGIQVRALAHSRVCCVGASQYSASGACAVGD